MAKKKLTIRLPLEGKLLEDFERLKEHYGIETGSDLMRFLIKHAYRELVEGKKGAEPRHQ